MLFRNTVVFITLAKDAPPASRTADRFASDCRVCCSIPSGIFPETGSIGNCPDANTNCSVRVAWEYGPAAGAALSVLTRDLVFMYVSDWLMSEVYPATNASVFMFASQAR